MWVNNSKRHFIINIRYLNSRERLDLYLDLIRELVQVHQNKEETSLARVEDVKDPIFLFNDDERKIKMF